MKKMLSIKQLSIFSVCFLIQYNINAQLTPSLAVYKNGNTLITSTWGAKLSEVTTDNPYEGGQHYKFSNYDLGGSWWDGFGLNLDSYGASNPLNFATKTHLRLAYRGLSTGHVLQVKLKDRAGQLGSNIDVGEASSTYKVVDIPLSLLGVGVNLQTISEIDISVGGAATGTGTVYVDAIEVISTSSAIYKGNTTLVTDTWGAKLSEVTTDNPYEGGRHYKFSNYDLGGSWWDGFGLNLDSYGASNPLNFATKTHLRLAYRGLSTGHVLQVKLKDRAGQLGSNIDVGEASSTYKVVDIPLSLLGVGVNLQTISEIDISVGGAATGTGTVYVDAIELISTSSLIYKSSTTLITGIWSAKLSEVTTDNPYEGGQHYKFSNYDLGGNNWDGFGLNLDNFGTSTPVNFAGQTHLRLAYRGLTTGHVLQVKLKDQAMQLGPNIDIGEASSTYKVVDVPLTQLSTGINLQMISEIDISVGGAATGTGTVYVDAIELVNKSGATTTTLAATRAARIGIGTNTANWLEAHWLLASNNYPILTQYTEQDFLNYAAYGFKTIRLPVIFERLASPTPPYTLNTSNTAFRLIDSAIAWANRYNLNLIIDNHHGSPELSDANYSSEIPHLTAIWQQLIQRYGYLNPEKFFFELYNEPNGISNTNTKAILQATVDAIRSTGDKHTLIVGGSSWNAGSSLNLMGTLADTNLIYTFHSYDPFLFCNQGFDWNGDGVPDYAPAGIPFPENASTIPNLINSFAAIKDWATQNNVPIFLGEFGASTFADATSRCNWISTMGQILDTYQIPACYWDSKYWGNSYGFFVNEQVIEGNVIPCFATALHLSYRHSTIPVELLNFKATPLSKIVTLDWQTATERNASHFDVERSMDGKVFSKIGQTKAHNNSSIVQTYTMVDDNPNMGLNYYRLRQIDFDGASTTSNIVSVRLDNKGKITVAPNPVHDHVSISFDNNDKKVIRVFDLLGRVILTKISQDTTIDIDLTTLQAGQYILEVSANGQSFREKLMKY